MLTLCFDRADRALAEELATHCQESETAHQLQEGSELALPQSTSRLLILISAAALEADWLEAVLDQVQDRGLPCLIYQIETVSDWPTRVANHPHIDGVDALRECLQSFEFYTED